MFDFEILKKYKQYLNAVQKMLDSYFEDHEDHLPLWYLGKSLQLLAEADVAYFAKDWEQYRGCRIENECAIEYGINVIEDYRE